MTWDYAEHRKIPTQAEFAKIQERRRLNAKLEAVHNTLLTACKEGDLATVRSLVERKVDIHFNKDEAIIRAAMWHRMAVFQFLLSCGADIFAQDDECVIVAAESGGCEMTWCLLELGASRESAMKYGKQKVKDYIEKQEQNKIINAQTLEYRARVEDYLVASEMLPRDDKSGQLSKKLKI